MLSVQLSLRKKNFQIGATYHYKILQAIKARDKEMAATYMRYHIRLGMEQYKEVLNKEKHKEEGV